MSYNNPAKCNNIVVTSEAPPSKAQAKQIESAGRTLITKENISGDMMMQIAFAKRNEGRAKNVPLEVWLSEMIEHFGDRTYAKSEFATKSFADIRRSYENIAVKYLKCVGMKSNSLKTTLLDAIIRIQDQEAQKSLSSKEMSLQHFLAGCLSLSSISKTLMKSVPLQESFEYPQRKLEAFNGYSLNDMMDEAINFAVSTMMNISISQMREDELVIGSMLPSERNALIKGTPTESVLFIKLCMLYFDSSLNLFKIPIELYDECKDVEEEPESEEDVSLKNENEKLLMENGNLERTISRNETAYKKDLEKKDRTISEKEAEITRLLNKLKASNKAPVGGRESELENLVNELKRENTKHQTRQKESDNAILELKRKISILEKENEALNLQMSELAELVPDDEEDKEWSEVDRGRRYIFLVNTEVPVANKLKTEFPNSIVSEQMVDVAPSAVDACICLTKNIPHGIYNGMRTKCGTLGVPFLHCHKTNMNFVLATMAKYLG